MTAIDPQLRAELDAVYADIGENMATREQLAERGYIDPQTLVQRGVLKQIGGKMFSRNWPFPRAKRVPLEGFHQRGLKA